MAKLEPRPRRGFHIHKRIAWRSALIEELNGEPGINESPGELTRSFPLRHHKVGASVLRTWRCTILGIDATPLNSAAPPFM